MKWVDGKKVCYGIITNNIGEFIDETTVSTSYYGGWKQKGYEILQINKNDNLTKQDAFDISSLLDV